MIRDSTTSTGSRLLYNVYGRGLVSDIDLPALRPDAAVSPCVQITRGSGLVWPTSDDLIYDFWAAEREIFRFEQYGRDYLWTYPSVGAFEIRRDGSSICWYASDGHRDDVASLLYGPVLGFALGLQGMMTLHGGAVATTKGAVAILAPSGYGKSTTVAGLLQKHLPLLTDDIVAIEFVSGAPWVIPGYARVKLRPDAIAHYCQSDTKRHSPLHISWGDKRVLTVDGLGKACGEPQPLAACFVLLPVAEDAAAHVTKLTGKEALLGLLANSYNVNRMMREPALQAAEWDCYQKIAQSTPVYLVEAPRDLARLDELTDLMLSTAGIQS